jgi:hypothetical protein
MWVGGERRHADPAADAAEVAALLELKAMPGNDALPELSNWVGCPCNASAPSRWSGVKCSSNGRVVEMWVRARKSYRRPVAARQPHGRRALRDGEIYIRAARCWPSRAASTPPSRRRRPACPPPTQPNPDICRRPPRSFIPGNGVSGSLPASFSKMTALQEL